MADNTFITGAAEGALAESLNGLPPWATEHTLYKIQSIMTNQAKILGDIVKNTRNTDGMTPAEIEKLNSELDKYIKNITTGNKEEEKKQKNDKKRVDADKRALFGAKEFDNKWQKARFVLDGLADIGKKVLTAEKQYITTQDAMYKSGINVLSGQNAFTDGFQALNHVVTQTGLKLETLQAVSTKYSSSINAVGFMKYAKAVGMAQQGMTKLNFSSTAAAEMMGAYIDQESHYTDMRGKSESEMSAGVQKFSKQVKDASQALGISREEVLANSKAMAQSSDLSVIASESGQAAADNVKAALMGVPPEMAAQLTDLVANAGANVGIFSKGVMSMITSGNHYSGQMMQQAQDLKKMDVKEFSKKWSSMVNSSDWNAEKVRMQQRKTLGVEGAAQALQTMVVMQNYANRVSQATDVQTDNTDATQKSITKLDTEIERFGAVTQAAFSPTIAQVTLLGDGLKKLNDVLYTVINHTNAETRSWAGVGLMAAGGLAAGATAVGTGKTILNLAKGARTAGAVAEGATAVGGAASAATVALTAGTVATGIFAAYETSRLGMALKDLYDIKHREGVQLSAGSQARINAGELSKLKTPAASTINSPSAVSSANTQQDISTDTSAGMPVVPMAPGIEKSKSGSDINNTLIAQNNLLEQIRLASVKQVETSESILKYTRNRT